MREHSFSKFHLRRKYLVYAFLILSLILMPSRISFNQNRLGDRTFGITTVDTTPTLPALPKREQFFDSWLVIHQLLMSITQGENELQRYLEPFSNNVPIGLIQQVYAAAKTVTANGNARIDASQSEFGGASGSFDGSNSYLSTPDSVDWFLGTGDFTIDFWVRFNSVARTQPFFEQYADGSNLVEVLWYKPDNAVYFRYDFGGVHEALYGAAWTPSTNTWYHLAFVRSDSNFYIFINGVSQTLSVYSAIDSDSLGDIAASVRIGYTFLYGNYANGWLDEYRVSKGVARWTSNFTPPTVAYTSDSYTVLLLHMDGTNGSTTFTDDSPFTGPVPYGFNVKASATQIVVTLMFSWTGSGAPPQGSVTISAPSGTVCYPSCSEAAGAVYDRTSISVSTTGNTYNVIHRVTFTITPPGVLPAWTAYVALSGVSTYTVTIEVS